MHHRSDDAHLCTVRRFPHIIPFLLLLLAGSSMMAQQRRTINYPAFNDTPAKQTKVTNAAELNASLQSVYRSLLLEGYMDAQIDTLAHDSIIDVKITPGKAYSMGQMTVITDSAGFNKELVKFRPATPMGDLPVRIEADKWLRQSENKGFPFASLAVEEMSFDTAGKAFVTLHLYRGPRFVFDSLVIVSSAKMPRRYIQGYTNLKKGEYYSEEKMQGLQGKLRELPFLQASRPPEINFIQGKYNLKLFLQKKKANYFNGILGLRPDEGSGKINITGDLEVKLMNAFNTGEEFYFNWRKLQPQTQDLTLNISLPYLFSSPIGIDGDLKIYRRDSTFSSVKSGLGLVFHFGGNDKLKVFVEKNTTSQLASFVTAQSIGNVNSTFYGLFFQKEKLDYRWNPRKGFALKAELATGTRNPGNSNNPEQPAITITRKNVHRAEASIEFFIPTWKNQTVRLSGMGGAIDAESIYDNEMFRIGGLRTLRGFNEESIFVTSWAVTSFEYRLLLETNSAVYVFADQAWYEKKGNSGFITDTPLGFGAGVNFETGAGIFTFNYALGTQFDNPLLVRNAKISFGFRNVF